MADFQIGMQIDAEHMQNIFGENDAYIKKIEDDLNYNNNYRKVAEGFAVREEKGNIIVSKGDYCLNSNDRKAIRRWKAKDHIFDYTGKVVWTQGRYEVNEKEIKQMN